MSDARLCFALYVQSGPLNNEPPVASLYGDATSWLVSQTRDISLPSYCPPALEAGLVTLWREAKRRHDSLPITIGDDDDDGGHDGQGTSHGHSYGAQFLVRVE